MSWILRKKKKRQEEKSYFIKNGGILLEELIKSSKGKYYPFRSFSIKEIMAATDNFNMKSIIDDGSYQVYKAFLRDRFVCIVKYKSGRYDECLNNIVFPAQISHRNAVKLIGCCLETEFPIIVFESFEDGSLKDHIGNNRKFEFEPMLWTHRLKIAIDIANIVSYLHFGLSRSVVFRDIQPSQIYLDEKHRGKLFGFDLCVSIPEDKTYIDNLILCGTLGYMAPEYCGKFRCNEKSDVYSFGMLLFFLLTGKSPYDLYRESGYDDKFFCDGCKEKISKWIDDEHVFQFDDAGERGMSDSDDDEHVIQNDDDEHLIQNDDAGERSLCYRCSMLGHVVKNVENNRLEEIADPFIVGDGLSGEKTQQLRAFADLAVKCCAIYPMDRPTMIDVVKELKKISLSSSS